MTTRRKRDLAASDAFDSLHSSASHAVASTFVPCLAGDLWRITPASTHRGAFVSGMLRRIRGHRRSSITEQT